MAGSPMEKCDVVVVLVAQVVGLAKRQLLLGDQTTVPFLAGTLVGDEPDRPKHEIHGKDHEGAERCANTAKAAS
jgi:hypothetical protein